MSVIYLIIDMKRLLLKIFFYLHTSVSFLLILAEKFFFLIQN